MPSRIGSGRPAQASMIVAKSGSVGRVSESSAPLFAPIGSEITVFSFGIAEGSSFERAMTIFDN